LLNSMKRLLDRISSSLDLRQRVVQPVSLLSSAAQSRGLLVDADAYTEMPAEPPDIAPAIVASSWVVQTPSLWIPVPSSRADVGVESSMVREVDIEDFAPSLRFPRLSTTAKTEMGRGFFVEPKRSTRLPEDAELYESLERALEAGRRLADELRSGETARSRKGRDE
jgi:hypothetical protein